MSASRSPVRRQRRAALAVLLGLVLALLAACGSANGSSGGGGGGAAAVVSGGTGWHGSALSKGYPLPDLTFTDTEGDRVTPAEAATTPVTLVFFGYSHCPDICNVVLANWAAALRGASPAVRDKVRLLFITTDPARDTPPVVRGYLDRFDPSFEGLVAPVDTVARAAKALYTSYEKPDGTQGGSYEVQHGTYTTGFLRGRAKLLWSEGTSVAGLRSDLTRLAGLA